MNKLLPVLPLLRNPDYWLIGVGLSFSAALVITQVVVLLQGVLFG
jgi:hypothetical protein